jgi:hypothetical protein
MLKLATHLQSVVQVGLLLFGLGTLVRAQSEPEWEVIPGDSPREFLQLDGQVEGVVEASGVEPIGTGARILVVHDKAPALRVYDLETGRQVGEPISCTDFPSGLEVGPKWEGLALDAEWHYYVIGSHSGKNDDERGQRAYLYRFVLEGDGTAAKPYTVAPGSVRRWHVHDGLIEALKRDGVDAGRLAKRKIEGLAVRESRDASGKIASRILAIGLREPDDLVRVFEVDITQTPENEARLVLHRAFAFEAGKSEDGAENLQLTALERFDVGPRPGYLVVTASEDKSNVFHGNRLWFIPDAMVAAATPGQPVHPQVLWKFEPVQKAEGFAILPGNDANTVAAVVTFDNDAHTTKTPSRLQRLTLRRRSAAP